ncbi:MAG TPA: AAA family ATPase, partial [Saprospiraceae bacterium]|nr:AAA family ATPase [Saprospiraceae bacterium]
MTTDDMNLPEDAGLPTPEEMVPANLDNWQRKRLDLSRIASGVQRIREELAKVIVGQYDGIDMMLAAIFSGGHILVEGVPGIAKTLMAKLLARTLNTGFSRIQFTPDLMPSDVIGTTVFNVKTSEFSFNKGPVF